VTKDTGHNNALVQFSHMTEQFISMNAVHISYFLTRLQTHTHTCA